MKITFVRSGDEITVSIRGDINESSENEFKDLLARLEVPSVVFEMDKVDLINSLGARYWIGLIQPLAKQTPKIRFRKCSPSFVESCNIYPKFVPKHSIESLYLIVDCPQCMSQQTALVSRDNCLTADPASHARCPQCSGPVEPSVDLDEYLQCVRD